MLADTLKAIAGQRLVDTDGDVTHLELLPPATEQQIRELEAKLPGPLPDEIRAALAVTTGFAVGQRYGADHRRSVLEVCGHVFSITDPGRRCVRPAQVVNRHLGDTPRWSRRPRRIRHSFQGG